MGAFVAIGVVVVGYFLARKKTAPLQRVSAGKTAPLQRVSAGKNAVIPATVGSRFLQPATTAVVPAENPMAKLAREGNAIFPTGGGFISDTLSAGANTALGAAKTYADAKTGGAVTATQGKIEGGNYVGAAGSYNAGVTVAQPKK